MVANWSADERRLFIKLNTPEKIQSYLESTPYNPDYFIKSPRLVMKKKTAHCFEGALLAAAVLEFHGQKPMLMHLKAFNDDHHVVTLVREGKKWGAISKTNTTMLGFRSTLFSSVEALAASYFDFYFNTKRELSLLGYAAPIHLNKFNYYDWRQTEKDLTPMGLGFLKLEHETLATKKELLKMNKVSPRLKEACFYKSDTRGLF